MMLHLPGATRLDCAAHSARFASVRPEDIRLVVVHWTAWPVSRDAGEARIRRWAGARAAWQAAGAQGTPPRAAVTSTHLVIGRDGRLWQLVPFHRAAWHAGVSSWPGATVGRSVNRRSIGVDLDSPGIDRQGLPVPYPQAQLEALRLVLRTLRREFPAAEVVGHRDVSPGRKVDPGPYLAREVLAEMMGGAP